MNNLKNLKNIKKVFSVSISSWFCVPEQGMKDFEILSRASAFLVRAKTPFKDQSIEKQQDEKKYHVLTASHVVAPWRWPKEWLQHLNESHTYYTIEMRHSDGVFITQSELLPISYHHPSRDLAVLHMEAEGDIEELMKPFGYDVLDLAHDSNILSQVKDLDFIGHQMLGRADESDDQRKPVPRVVKGSFSHRTAQQTFANTWSVLTDGMCGGPVVASAPSNSSNNDNKVVVGLLEGIVPNTYPVPDLRNMAEFVESQDILRFISDVEEGHVVPLVGGAAVEHVGSDLDESKMGLDYIMKTMKDLDEEELEKKKPDPWATDNFKPF